MSTLSDLERRIQILEDIEAIKRLKVRYWNSVDSQQWDNMADCITEDFVFESPQLGKMEGRDIIVKVLKKLLKYATTAHQGHNPEIEINSDTTARGRWALNDRVELPDRRFFRGYRHYEDEYVKENGSWKIRRSKLTNIFQESSPEL